jgi:hypothetical protein
MANSDNKTDGATDTTTNNSGSNGSSDTTKPEGESAVILKPDGAPPASGASDGNGNENSGPKEGRARDLSQEQALSQEIEQNKSITLSVQEQVSKHLGDLASYQLKPEIMAEVANGITGPVMAGIKVTMQMMDSVVQKVDPIAHAGKHLRDSLGINAVAQNVENSHSGQLSLQTVGQVKTTQLGAIQNLS